MSWVSIREYTIKNDLSTSTVRRHIRQGKISARKFGRNWYIEYPDSADMVDQLFHASVATQAGPPMMELPRNAESNIQSVVDFSSKALHHYLMLHEKLMSEKEVRLQEKEAALNETKQEVAELEAYARLLEAEIERLKNRPEGWM